MSPLPDDFLLLCTRTLSGEASADERRRLDEHLQEADCRAFYADLCAQWRAWPAPEAPAFDPHPAYARLAAKLAASKPSSSVPSFTPAPTPPLPPTPPPTPSDPVVIAFPSPSRCSRPSRRLWPWVAAAAALVALTLLPWLGRTLSPPAASPAPWQERVAAAGQQSVIMLADGSRVTLNGASSLSFPATFDGTRTVHLRGEAYFEITHDAARPFVVEAGGVKTIVLGTKFNVSASPDSPTTHVALVEGRVEVGPLDAEPGLAPVTLRPGQQFSLERKSRAGWVGEFDSEVVTGWLRGLLVFREERLAQVAARLERRFGVTFEITDPAVTNKAITARFEKESLPEILEILSFAGGIRCEPESDTRGITHVRLRAVPVSPATPAR